MGGKVGPLQRTRSLLTSADALRAGEQYQSAISELERALEDEGARNPDLQAEILLRLADCHAGLNHHEQGCQVLLPLLEGPDPAWEARAMTRVARSLFYRHDLESSETLCREAIAVLAPTNQHDDVALAYQWLGNALQAQGLIEEAAESFRDAIAAAARSENRMRRASCLGSMGCLDIARSRYPEAVRSLERCLEEVRHLGHRVDIARSTLHLAVCWTYLGDWTRAHRLATEAHDLYGKMGDARGLAIAILARLRLARRMEQPAEVDRLLRAATRELPTAEFERVDLQLLLRKGDQGGDRGDFETARSLYEEARDRALEAAPGGDLAFIATRRLASVTSRLGDHVTARTLAEEALAASRAAQNRREAACCRRVLAQIHWRSNARELALPLIDEAIRQFRELQTPWELAHAHQAAADIRRADADREHAHLNEACEIRGRLGLRVDDLVARLNRGAATLATAVRVDEIVARGTPMVRAVETARELWRFPGCVLLFGETGTGKELLARLIHDSSPDADQPFVIVDCAAHGAAELERQLFGQGGVGASAANANGADERGADASRADANHPGALQCAGTVLLRSVHALPPSVQARLAAAIDARQFRPLGASGNVALRARIVAATHEHLPTLAEEDRFLSGLVHRLSMFRLDVPPLRDRAADVVPLAELLIQAHPEVGAVSFAPEAAEALATYPWPGNGRELANAVESALFHARDETVLRLEHLPSPISDAKAAPHEGLPARIAGLERREIRAAMAASAGNKKRAAELLGVSRKGLIDRLKRLGLWDEFTAEKRPPPS